MFLQGSEKHQGKKRVRFAKQATEVPMEKKNINNGRNVRRAQRMKGEQVWVMENAKKCGLGPKLEDTMPLNRAVLYRGIMKYRNRTPSGRFRF